LRRFRDPLILAALASFAITQPLLSDFRAGAGFFVARRSQPVDIVLLALTLTVVPGLVAALLVWIAGRFSARAGSGTRIGLVWLFAALTVHTALVRFSSWPWPALMVISGCVGVVVAVGYVRSISLRSFLTYVIPAPLIFLLFFLFTPPVAGLVLPKKPAVQQVEVEATAPVIVLILDEFPVVSLLNADGEIDSTRYPNFVELASLSTWYKHAAAVHDNTLFAVPSILSGVAPNSSLLPTSANYPGNLFTLFAPSHQMHVIEPFTDLCPVEVCGEAPQAGFSERATGLLGDSVLLYRMLLTPDPTESVSVTDPFDEFLSGAMSRVNEEAATDQVGRFGEFLDQIDGTSSTLHFMHLFLPHAPFHLYPSRVQYNSGDELLGQEEGVWVDPVLAAQAQQRHLLQVQAVDSLIGDLLRTLEVEGVLDEALIVVTADHGISFEVGESRRSATQSNAYEIGMVPLFIKAPNQDEGRVDPKPARSIDVLPTLADHLGVQIPWDHDGRSLLEEVDPPPNLTIESISGNQIVLDQVERGLAAAVNRVSESFQGDGDGVDPYAMGDFGSLVGSTSLGVNATEASGIVARVAEAGRFVHVQPETGWVPGFIHGVVTGEVNGGLHVALELNGAIVAVVPLYGIESGRASFSAILPEGAFVEGFNSLQVYAVSGSPQSPAVAAVRFEDLVRYELDETGQDGATLVIDADGRSWSPDPGSALIGYVDTATWVHSGFESSSPTDLQLQGWAIDEAVPKPAERIVFFADGEFAGSTPLEVERPGLVDVYGTDDVLVSGYLARLPYFSPDVPPQVRAFALSDDVAVELVIVDSALSMIAAG